MSTQPQPVKTAFDSQDQYKRILPYVLPGETLHVVYNLKGADTGFVGVTDQRIIFYDKNNPILSGNNKRTIMWVPYNQVVALGVVDEGTWIKTSELVFVTAAGKFSFEFMGTDKAQWVYQFVTGQILNQRFPQLKG